MVPYGMTINSMPMPTQQAGWKDWVQNYFHPPPPQIVVPRNRDQELQDYMRFGPKPTVEGQTPPPTQNYYYQGDVPENTPGPRVNPPDAVQFGNMLDWNKRWSEDVGWGV